MCNDSYKNHFTSCGGPLTPGLRGMVFEVDTKGNKCKVQDVEASKCCGSGTLQPNPMITLLLYTLCVISQIVGETSCIEWWYDLGALMPSLPHAPSERQTSTPGAMIVKMFFLACAQGVLPVVLALLDEYPEVINTPGPLPMTDKVRTKGKGVPRQRHAQFNLCP